MEAKMTWEEMKKQFPNEWLLIVNFEVDPQGHLIAGMVERHSSKKDEVYFPPYLEQDAAFRYTGESTFAGLRSHVEYHHHF